MLSSFIYWNCLLRVVGVGQSDSSESSHTPAVGKLPTLSMPIVYELIVAIVDSHIRWKLFLFCLIFEVNHFIRQKQAFNSTRKFIGGMVPWVRENYEVNPKLISGKFRSHDTEKLPPYWNSRSQPNEARCWPSLLNENWCLCNLSHGITLQITSYRFT